MCDAFIFKGSAIDPADVVSNYEALTGQDQLNVYFEIAEHSQITFTCPASELGGGIGATDAFKIAVNYLQVFSTVNVASATYIVTGQTRYDEYTDTNFVVNEGDILTLNLTKTVAGAEAVLILRGKVEQYDMAVPVAGFEDEAEALFTRMLVVSADRQLAINSMIRSLKSEGIWDNLYRINVYAAENEQQASLNWKSTSFNSIPVNAPTFTANVGYQGDGSTQYINTQFNPNIDAAAGFNPSGAVFGAAVMNNASSAGFLMGGQRVSPFSYLRLNPWTGGGVTSASSHTGGADVSIASGNSLGLWVIARYSSTSLKLFKNGVQVAATATATDSRLMDSPLYELAMTNGGSPINHSTHQIGMTFYATAAITDSKVEALHSIWQTFLTAIS